MFSFNKERFEALKNENAVIVCDRNEVKDSLTHEEVKTISDKLSAWINVNMKEKPSCIGLRMDHNIYIPSIIDCLRRLCIPFMFLNELSESAANIIKIPWIISSQADSYHDKLAIRNDFLYLEKHSHDLKHDSTNIFYITSTSGTTGDRKVVRVPHHCIESNIRCLSKIFEIKETDVIYLGSPLTFDPSMVEILMAIYNGCCLCMTTKETRINRNYLYECLLQRITILQIVPSLFLLWNYTQIEEMLLNPKLRILAFGGEQIPQQILNMQKSTHLRIFNLYGITEVSCWASIYELTGDDKIPIGIPLSDTIVEVRNEQNVKITEGEGEIWIGSKSRICLVDNEKNLEKPVFRKTGDLARITAQGIFCIGRKNDVFKRFGHKVKLSKVERIIFKETSQICRCIWYEEESKLLAFIQSQQDKIIDKIRLKLLHTMQPELFPDYFEIIPKFPTTTNGKLDTKFLIKLYRNRNKLHDINAQERFKIMVCKYFGFPLGQFEEISNMKFFEIGGNSILAVQLFSELGEHSQDFQTALFEKTISHCLEALRECRKIAQDKVIDKPAKKLKVNTDVRFTIKWKYDMQACVDASPLIITNNDGFSSVAVGSFSRFFVVLDAISGGKRMKCTLPDSIEGKACYSPCKNFLYIPCFDGIVYSIDYKNNKILWKYQCEDKVKSTPVLCRQNTAIAIGSYDKYLHCVDICDGKCYWKCFLSESVVSTPLTHNGHLFVTTLHGSCFYIEENNGNIIWRYKSTHPIFATSCTLNNNFIVANVNGSIFALSPSGEKLWEYNCNGFLYSSPLIYNNSVICTCHDNNLYVINEKIEVKTIDLGYKVSSTPCFISDDCIVVATNSGRILVLDLAKESILGQFDLPGEVFSSPCCAFGRIYVGCRDNNFYCIEMKS